MTQCFDRVIDFTMGIHPVAWSVAHYVERLGACEIPKTGWITTAPWYNGREQGIVLSFKSKDYSQQLNLAWFEHRNTDNICILKWMSPGRINPPTIDSDGQLAYPHDDKYDDIDAHFECHEIHQAAEWIVSELKAFADIQIGAEQ